MAVAGSDANCGAGQARSDNWGPRLLRPLLWEVNVKPSGLSPPMAPQPDEVPPLSPPAGSAADSASGSMPPTVVVGLPTLDTVQGESIALFLWSDARPLGGVAGTVDWRVCGGLSRLVQEALFAASEGEVLLYPVSGRFGPRRLFLFGLGPVGATNGAALRRACRRAYEALRNAGASRIVFGAPVTSAYPSAETDFLQACAQELPGQVHTVLVSRVQTPLESSSISLPNRRTI